MYRQISSIFRRTPHFRGKARLGSSIGDLLIGNFASDDCISAIEMSDGSRMILDPRSRTERWAYWTGRYDTDIIEKLATCFEPGFTILDVGANVGFYSIAWGRELAKVGGHLYAFEPVSRNFDRIQQSIKLNHLQETVHAVQIGLGDQDIELPIIIEITNNSQTGNAVIVQGDVRPDKDSVTENIRLTTLDGFVERESIERCDLIKIDIEGAEAMFVKGGLNFLSKHRPIIYGEFNAYWIKKLGASFRDVVDLLHPLGYRFFQEVGRKANFVEIHDFENEVENILIIPNTFSSENWGKIGIID